MRRVTTEVEIFYSGGDLLTKCILTVGSRLKKPQKKINIRLLEKFGCEISLGVQIGKGIKIPHHTGIVIHHSVKIGDNFVIRQNTTIGKKDGDPKSAILIIGDNVDIGANTCIIGLTHKIGNNVKIGGMSFINNDIPDNCTYVTKKEARIINNTKQ